LLSETASDEELLSVGVIGAVATFGIFVYEMRNTRQYGATVGRLNELDTRLGIRLFDPPESPTLGPIRVRQLLALELVYGAALAAWLYLVFWSALDLFGVPWPRLLGAVIGTGVAAAIVVAAPRAVAATAS